MTIDTEIRHVTKAGANLFLELGFSAAEAKQLRAASRKQINDTRALKQQLMVELSNWITEHQLKQADAAQILMVSRPRVSDVVNQKTAKFSIDTLRQNHFIDGAGTPESHLGHFTAERWATTYKQLVDLKVTSAPIDPATAYTLQFNP